MAALKALRAAWGLFQSDDRRETYAAAAIVAVVGVPAVYALLEERGDG